MKLSHQEAVDQVNRLLKKYSWFRYARLTKRGQLLEETISIEVNNVKTARLFIKKSYYGYPAYFTKYKHKGGTYTERGTK